MWYRLALVSLVALSFVAPAGAASAPIESLSSDTAEVDSVVISAGPTGSTSVASGQPAIALGRGSAGGIAPDTRVVIGDPADPAGDHAFGLENRGDTPVAVSLRYEYHREPPDSAGLSFAVHEADGARLSAGDSSVTVSLEPGAMGYILVTISSHGMAPEDDLSGSLEFAVTRGR